MAATNLFTGLSESARREVIGFFRPIDFEPNDRIIGMGDEGTDMFLIEKGHVTVKVENGVVAELGPGDTFGEVCLADGGTRSASVFAVDRVRVHALEGKALDAMAREKPLYCAILLLNLLRLLGRKLRNADEEIEKHLSSERARQTAADDSIIRKIMARVG